MRLWINDADRRPDPAPLKTDDRKPLLLGILGWVVGLVVILAAGETIKGDSALWMWTCLAGVVLGLLGLGYELRRRRRA